MIEGNKQRPGPFLVTKKRQLFCKIMSWVLSTRQGAGRIGDRGWDQTPDLHKNLSVSQFQILRGGRYTLHKNNEEFWEVTDSGGNAIKAPGVCFMIPPTDPESLSMADK